jgi:hypothetical protein
MKVSHQEAPVSGCNPHDEGGAGEGLQCDYLLKVLLG